MFGNGPRWENSPRKRVRSKHRVRELKALPYFSLFLLAYTNTGTGLSGKRSFSLEFQQVAIDLVVYIGVVFLLTQV